MSLRSVVDTLWHRWLKIPYRLATHIRTSKGKPRVTIVLLHGIGNSTLSWNAVVDGLPQIAKVIAIDLLGFGESPRPEWPQYDATTQAKSVARVLLREGLTKKMIIVGHSMGALIAVEFAKRYPSVVQSLVLCSPPLYDWSFAEKKRVSIERMFREVYRSSQKNKAMVTSLLSLLTKYKIINQSFNVTDINAQSYFAALESSIMNQTAVSDIVTLSQPITIIQGAFDPVVSAKKNKAVAAKNKNISVQTILAGHEIVGSFVPATIKVINEHIAAYNRTNE